MENNEEILTTISNSLKRFEKDHVDEYIKKRKEDAYYRDVLQGMYMAIATINNDLNCNFGTDEVSKALGFYQLAEELEKNM